MKFTPHAYQLEAIKFLVAHPEAALFLDPGLGKTAITLTAYLARKKAGKAGPALVVAPLRVCYNVWTAEKGGELGKWDQFAGLKVALLHGKHKERALHADADLYVVNFDGLLWLLAEQQVLRGGQLVASPAPIEVLFAKGVRTLILDELSKMKDSQSKRFKAFARTKKRGGQPHLSRFTVRWGLTGSPASNGLLDLFGECYMLDEGKALGRYISNYRMQYFVPTGFKGYQWEPQPGAAERIYRQLENLAISMRAVDHLKGLPELVEENLWCDLPSDARKFYDEFEDEQIASLGDKVITAKSAGVVSGKLRQVASGGIYFDEGNTLDTDGVPISDVLDGAIPPGGFKVVAGVRRKLHVHHEKTDALRDLVDELQGQPLLVGYWFQHELDRIREKFGDAVPVINGDTKPAQAEVIISQWNERKIPLLFGHPQSMGHGLNMQFGVCGHVAFLTTPWDLDLYKQFIARVWRQGNKSDHVIVSRFMCRETIDELVARTIHTKAGVQDSLFEALKTFVEMRRTSRVRKASR